MKKTTILLAGMLAISFTGHAQEMDEMWGEQHVVKKTVQLSKQTHLFEWGNYAMFIHWGLFSQLGNQWKGKTYYGIGEWLMHKKMADIPVEEYKKTVKDFNPTDFDAHAIARLAKDAGMKYVVVTSKHHDGFAMYDSKVCDFNVVKQTPFGRDPMKELSEACRKQGLGFGFYYSHNQDWTYPGGNGGPKVDEFGESKTFDDYFREKCLPQVEEITKNYGEIELVWFDTPGGMPEKYAKELVEVVHRNQPHALVSGRVGYNMGDYQTLGDMEVPLENVGGLWESIDVTNDAWGYAWYDQNWKTPKQLLSNLISTIGRGGTYMMNVGPNPSGQIPEPAQMTLRSVGKWIAKYSEVIYGAESSPWNHALPWGDATMKEKDVNLLVYTWPRNGKLYVPGVLTDIKEIKLSDGKRFHKMNFAKEGNWLVINVPSEAPDPLVSVLKITPVKGQVFKADFTQAVDPELGVSISAKFARTEGGKAYKRQWMEKFGEWKTAFVVDGWKDNTSTTWEVDIKTPGIYQLELTYAGDSRLVWSIENEEGCKIQNQQDASHIYTTHPIGWMEFKSAGKHKLTVCALEGNREKASLMSIGVKPVVF